jgi:hypothetical protein
MAPKLQKRSAAGLTKKSYLEPLTNQDITLDFGLVNLGLILLRLLAVN